MQKATNEYVTEMLKKPEVSRRLGISKRTLEIWMADGRIPYFRIGKVIRFVWPDVLASLRPHPNQPRKEA